MKTTDRNFIIGGLVIAIIIAILAPFLASSNPDGLESAAESLGVPEFDAVINPHYPTMPFLEWRIIPGAELWL